MQRHVCDHCEYLPAHDLRCLTESAMTESQKSLPSEMQPPRPIDPGVRIGHVHLKVADLDRALAFYSGVLGFELVSRLASGAAFISAGGYHHHIGLNTWESLGGSPPPPGTTGLITRLSFIRPVLPWPMRFEGSWQRAFPWTVLLIIA